MTAESNGAEYRCFITNSAGEMASTRIATVKLDILDWTMEYDTSGQRTKRISDEKTYTYIYAGDNLMRMTVGDDVLDFSYDASGAPLTMTYNGTVYYYITNLQGDVTSLEQADGGVGAQYAYDAWGNIIAITGTLAELNPLRYRGYVYDQETGFYYLNSRYYDPAVMRFISADNYASTGQGILGHNMFTYCGNDPVNRADTGGYIWHIVAGAAIGAAFGVGTKIITNLISGEKWTTGLLTAGLAGAVSGGLAASGVGLAGQIVGNAVISMANNAVDQVLSDTSSFDWGAMMLDGVIGAGAGYIGGNGAGSKNLTKIGVTNLKRTWNALTNKGLREAASTFSKGITYFVKNAGYIRKPLLVALGKSSATIISSTIVKKLTTMERSLTDGHR